MIYIYGLFDPRNGNLRYIGKSIRPKERLTNHMNDKSITWRTNWIKKLKSCNLKPLLYIFEKTKCSKNWKQIEISYISKAKNKGMRLTNCTDGGDGVTNITGPGKERMLKTWKGRKHNPETLKKISESSKGRKHSEKSKSYMRKIMKGRKITWNEKLKKSVCKLSEKQIIKIRKLLKQKVSQYKIANMFGVHQGTISNIKNNKCYQHFKNEVRNA